MQIHFIQHVPFETPAWLLTWAKENGYTYQITHLYKGDTLPDPQKTDMLIVMGGPMGIKDEADYPWLKTEQKFIRDCIQSDKYILGICLGAQMIANVLGAPVTKNPEKEIGWFPVQKSKAIAGHPVFKYWADAFTAFHWHGDTFALPQGALPVGSTEACRNQGFIYQDNVIALQFHLECSRASIGALLEHCGDELTAGNFIQPRHVIEKMSEEKTVQSNQMMNDMLTCWTNQTNQGGYDE